MEALMPMAQRANSDVQASAAGDELAFRRIIAKHHEDMRRVCAYVTRDDVVAEEAAYAAWAIAWKKIGSVREPDSLRPWLTAVAVNEAKRLLRMRKRRAVIEIRVDGSGEAGGVDPATGIASIDLRAAVGRLDPDDRALIAMRYVAGFNATELAVATGKSPAAIRQRLKRLLDRLREDLA
jgi:RNA polymerase sigma-70 factor (ECF subfamily)